MRARGPSTTPTMAVTQVEPAMPKPRRAETQAAQPSAERIEALAVRERVAFDDVTRRLFA